MDANEYHEKQTRFFSQFRSTGTNYNQIVKILYRNFSEKKAAAYLYKLEKQTVEMIEVFKKVLAVTEEFNMKYLNKTVEDDSKNRQKQ